MIDREKQINGFGDSWGGWGGWSARGTEFGTDPTGTISTRPRFRDDARRTFREP